MEGLLKAQGGLAAATSVLQHLQQQEYTRRANLAIAISMVGGIYLHLFVRRIAPSYVSLLATAPLVVVNCCVPLLFSANTEIPSRIGFCINILWLANYKALGLCCHRGPLVSGPWSTAQTILLYMLPLYPTRRQESAVKKGRLSDHIGSPGAILGVFTSSAVLLGLIAFALTLEWLPTVARHYLLGLFLYSFINFMMAGPAAILVGLLNIEVVPAFDKPWLSTSLADYWSRRWNNTTSLLLRALVYDPIVEGTLMSKQLKDVQNDHTPVELKQPCSAQTAPRTQQQEPLVNILADSTAASIAQSGTAAYSTSSTTAAAADSEVTYKAVNARSKKPSLFLKAAALTATFAVSGLMHEGVLYLCNDTDGYRFGYWFAFFVVQAPLLIAEGIVLQKLQQAGISVPKSVGIMYNTFFVLLTAYLFWFPPLERHSNIAQYVVRCINGNVQAVVDGLRQLLVRIRFVGYS